MMIIIKTNDFIIRLYKILIMNLITFSIIINLNSLMKSNMMFQSNT
jgi:hypothetical protein